MTAYFPAIPIVNAGLLYVNNMQSAWASNTTLAVAAGQCRDSTDTTDITVTATSTTVNAATTGLNGLDSGSLAASTWYALYAIGSSYSNELPGYILSTSFSAPTLPFGYDVYRRIGAWLTDGSSHFVLAYQYGNGSTRQYFWDAVVTELNAGASATFADVDLATSMPSTSTLAYLNWKIVPATAGNIANLRVKGSSSTTNVQITGSVAAQPNTGFVWVNTNTSQVIQYKVGNASDALTLYFVAFVDFI